MLPCLTQPVFTVSSQSSKEIIWLCMLGIYQYCYSQGYDAFHKVFELLKHLDAFYFG